MTLQDALALAATIDASATAQLITIGRFLPVDQITAESPWGCAVRQPDGMLQTVWSLADWADLQPSCQPTALASGPSCQPTALAAGHCEPPAGPCSLSRQTLGPRPANLAPDTTPDTAPDRQAERTDAERRATLPPRRDAAHLRQPSLF